MNGSKKNSKISKQERRAITAARKQVKNLGANESVKFLTAAKQFRR